MPVVGQPVQRSPVSMFRLEVDGIDVGATKVGSPTNTINVIDTREGGDIELTDHSVNGVTPDPIECERPLTGNTLIRDWFRNCRAGAQDKRQVAIFMLNAAGEELYRRDLDEVLCTKHSTSEMDGSTKDQEQKEMFTLKPKVIRDWVAV